MNKTSRDLIDYEYQGTYRKLSRNLGLVHLYIKEDLKAFVFDFDQMKIT